MVGQMVSLDQYQSSIPGSLNDTKGKESSTFKHTGGMLFNDHCFEFIFVFTGGTLFKDHFFTKQVSLGAGVTLIGNCEFELMFRSLGFWSCAIMEILAFTLLKALSNAKEYLVIFSGTGAHHHYELLKVLFKRW